MAIFQKEYDELKARDELRLPGADPSIVPHGDAYEAIKDLLEYINEGATDRTTSTGRLAKAIAM